MITYKLVDEQNKKWVATVTSNYTSCKNEKKEFKVGDIVAIVNNDYPFEEQINYLLIIDKAKGLQSDKIYYKWRFCDKYGNFIYKDKPKVDNLSSHTKIGHIDFKSEQ